MSPRRLPTDLLAEIREKATEIALAERAAIRARSRRDHLFLKAQQSGCSRSEIAEAGNVTVAAVKFVLSGRRNRRG
jgi:predicted anti-sigma-YlaC factor YlaD